MSDLHWRHKVNDHNKARVESLTTQIHQASERIHNVINQIKEGVAESKVMEVEIHNMKHQSSQELSDAFLVINEAEAKIKDVSAEHVNKFYLFESPPKGLEALARCYAYLLAGVLDQSVLDFDTEKRPKDTNWISAREMFKDGNMFLEGLNSLRHKIEKLEVPQENVEAIKPILVECFYELEGLHSFSTVAMQLYGFLQKAVTYYDLVQKASAHQQETMKISKELEASSERLIKAEEEMNQLKNLSDQLYKELEIATSEP